MASEVAPLPREPDALIEIIAELRDENGQLRAMVETLKRAWGAIGEVRGRRGAAGAWARGPVDGTRRA
jgi:hypothetical protein